MAAGAGLEVEPDQEKVPVGVGAGGPDCVGELGELPIVERPSSTRRSQRLAERSSGVGADVADVHGAGVHGAERRDTGLPGGSEGRVRPVGSGAFGGGVDDGGEVGGGELGQVAAAEESGGEPPVRAVGGRSGGAEGRGDLVDPRGDGDRPRLAGGGGDEVVEIESERAGFLQQDPGAELAVHRTRSRS